MERREEKSSEVKDKTIRNFHVRTTERKWTKNMNRSWGMCEIVTKDLNS